MELYFYSPNTPSWRGAQLKAWGQPYLHIYLQMSCDVPLRWYEAYSYFALSFVIA